MLLVVWAYVPTGGELACFGAVEPSRSDSNFVNPLHYHQLEPSDCLLFGPISEQCLTVLGLTRSTICKTQPIGSIIQRCPYRRT